MPFIPSTNEERQEMLKTIGVSTVQDLFSDLPKDKLYPNLGFKDDALSELEVLKEMEQMSKKNLISSECSWFLGAGLYNHFIPSVVPALSGRSEFLTSYTPYQAEVSQGTLQAIFEFQSMTAELFGIDVVNASHYDGATALAEAVIMSIHACSGRKSIMIPYKLHPEYKEVLKTYLTPFDVELVEYFEEPNIAAQKINENTCSFVCSYPDFEGIVNDLSGIAESVHSSGALFIVNTNPIMLSLFKSPGSFGADIVTAEGQCLGNPMNFGGPLLGMMGVTKKLMRKMPGRIVGQAFDSQGRRGFVLTLSAREQHIRREKAVSNICSNEGLSMLNAAIYMEAMGKNGLQKIARQCWDKSHYAANLISGIPGFSVSAIEEDKTFFFEFVVNTSIPAEKIINKLEEKNIVAGLALSKYYPERTHELLVCVTEMNTKKDIDNLVASLKEATL